MSASSSPASPRSVTRGRELTDKCRFEDTIDLPQKVVVLDERLQVDDRRGLRVEDMQSLHERLSSLEQRRKLAKPETLLPPIRSTDQGQSTLDHDDPSAFFQQARSFSGTPKERDDSFDYFCVLNDVTGAVQSEWAMKNL
jgi:hypothetical protein